MQCKIWIKNNIKIFNFLYFLCSAVFIGVLFYVAWKNDLSTVTFLLGMIFMIYVFLLNFEILRGGNKIFLLKKYTKNNNIEINEIVSDSGLMLLFVLIMAFIELGVVFNTIPTNLLFFCIVFFFLLLPLWISWDTLVIAQKLFYGFFFLYLIVVPQFDLSLYHDQKFILVGLLMVLFLLTFEYAIKKKKQ